MNSRRTLSALLASTAVVLLAACGGTAEAEPVAGQQMKTETPTPTPSAKIADVTIGECRPSEHDLPYIKCKVKLKNLTDKRRTIFVEAETLNAQGDRTGYNQTSVSALAPGSTGSAEFTFSTEEGTRLTDKINVTDVIAGDK
ncbi:FxLYD domain-containing protein [Streptomyces sp. NPDC056401]|uniref:FxLYD domain-containing protein n=1 Tax=Streptomyces sp. NPDC056401 TaxID=3345809 RepID=UPI0035D69523